MLRSPFLSTLRTTKEHVTLLGCVEDLQALLAEPDAYNIPQTLVHGDFNLDNVVGIPEKRDALRFIDWATDAIGHPFVDFVRFCYVDTDWGNDQDRENAQTQYLKRWEHCETKENIRRAVDLAYPVMLCESVYVLLKMYESAGRLAKEDYLILLKERLSSVLNVLNNHRQSRFGETDSNDGVSLLVISKDDGHQVLVKQDDAILSLPVLSAFQIDGHVAADRQVDSRGMRVMIKSQLGVDTRMVRSFWLHPESETDQIRCALVFESLDSKDQIPQGYEWVDGRAVDRFIGSTERERAIVQEFFRKRADENVAPPHMPWRSFGWFSRTREWTDKALQKHGLEGTDGFHEVKTDAFGTVWTCAVRLIGAKMVHTKFNYTENVFLKASILNKSEPEVHSAIATFAQGAVPSVVDTQPGLEAFLVTGIGKVDLLEMDWRLLFRGLGQLQVCSMAQIDMLVKAGLRIYDCGWVRSNVSRLLKLAEGGFPKQIEKD